MDISLFQRKLCTLVVGIEDEIFFRIPEIPDYIHNQYKIKDWGVSEISFMVI